jgi:hypothetical protein
VIIALKALYHLHLDMVDFTVALLVITLGIASL